MSNLNPLPVEETISLIRTLPTPDFLLRPLFPEKGIAGKSAEWTIYPNTRVRSRYTQFGNPARIVERLGVQQKSARMTHVREKKIVPATAKYDRRPGGQQNEAWSLEDQVADELDALNKNVEYAKEWERAQVLFGGLASLAYDDGSIELVDYAVSTSTHYQAVSSVWSGAGADIIGDISSRVACIRQDAGISPRHMIGGEGFYTKLIKNTVLQNYMKESPDGMRAILEGGWPRLMGMDIIEYNAGYLTSPGGTWTPFVPAGLVAFIADPAELGLMMLQGDAVEVGANTPGRFAKTYVSEDPSGLMALVDDVSLPIVEVPAGVAVATTT